MNKNIRIKYAHSNTSHLQSHLLQNIVTVNKGVTELL